MGTSATTAQLRIREGSVEAERLFYFIAASLVLLVTVVGFRGFYIHGKGFGNEAINPQILPWVISHGLAMTAWVILLFVQSLLIMRGNRRLHMVIGGVGGFLAAAIVVLGSITALMSARNNPGIYEPFGGRRFFLVEMWTEMLLFAAFVALALKWRFKPEIHRAMMTLATVSVISAALARTPYVSDLALIAPLYAFVLNVLFGAVLLLIQWIVTGKRMSRWYGIAYTASVVVCLASVALGRTEFWNRFAAAIVG